METEKIGKYNLVSKIADGGMAEVYLAETAGVGGFAKRVALKKILPYFTSDQSFVHSFINEARICGQLHHPNLVEVYGFDRSDDVYYLAMEYIDGLDLERILAHRRAYKEPFPIAAACALTLQVLDGLDYAHRARGLDGKPLSIVHRDLKPSNVLIDVSGVIKIVDFGIAKASSNVYKTRDLGTAKGTVGYMSPEQAIGSANLAPSSDLFSVGIILYELLTLRRLFEGKNVFAILEAVRTADVGEQLQELSALPEGLRKVLARSLAREQADRYSSAQEMIKELRSVSPVGRGHDLLSRFVKQLAEQGLTPLHGDAPPRAPTGTGESNQRTRVLDLAAPDAGLDAPVVYDDEATLPLPAAPIEATVALTPASFDPEDTFDPAATQRPFEAMLSEEAMANMDPAETYVPQRPQATRPRAESFASHEETTGPPKHMTVRGGSLLEDFSEPTPVTPRGEPTHHTEPERQEPTRQEPPRQEPPRQEPPRKEPAPQRPRPPRAPASPASRGRWLLLAVTLISLAVVSGLYSRFSERSGIYLRIESIPGEAEVKVDGKRVLSSTPGTFFFALNEPRKVNLTLHKQGYKTFVHEGLELRPEDDNVTFTFPLERSSGVGSLSLDTTPPGAEIWLDGERTGEYTPKTLEVEAGEHQLSLRRGGFKPMELNVQIKEGVTEDIARSLEAR